MAGGETSGWAALTGADGSAAPGPPLGMPLSKAGMIDMAPPSVLGSEARSASLANTGCRPPIGTSLALAAETGTAGTDGPDVPFSPDGGTAWAGVGWPWVVNGSKARMCAAGPLAPSPGIPLAPGVRLGEAGGAAMGVPGTCAVKASTAKTGAEGRLAPGPARPSAGKPLNSEFAIEAIQAGSGA